MLPDQVSNPGPITYESDALLIALRSPAVDILSRTYFGRVCNLKKQTGSHKSCTVL